MSTDGQGTERLRNIAENFNRLSRVHERYRQQTDRRQTDERTTTYSHVRQKLEPGLSRFGLPYWSMH